MPMYLGALEVCACMSDECVCVCVCVCVHSHTSSCLGTGLKH